MEMQGRIAAIAGSATDAIAEWLVWAGYALLSRRQGLMRRGYVRGILVQPVLLPSFSNLACHGALAQKGTVYSAHPIPRLLNAQSERQLAQSLESTLVHWQGCQREGEVSLGTASEAALLAKRVIAGLENQVPG